MNHESLVTQYYAQIVSRELRDGILKGRVDSRDSRSSHRYSNANVKFQFLFWNTNGSFSHTGNSSSILRYPHI